MTPERPTSAPCDKEILESTAAERRQKRRAAPVIDPDATLMARYGRWKLDLKSPTGTAVVYLTWLSAKWDAAVATA